MADQTTSTANELYCQIVSAFVSDPGLEPALLADFGGTVAQRFGVGLPKPGTLARTANGFRLTYDGQHYDLGDPRTAAKGELNDAELELVSAGGDAGCPPPGNGVAVQRSPDGNLPQMPMPSPPGFI
jgi:hypothetical protein